MKHHRLRPGPSLALLAGLALWGSGAHAANTPLNVPSIYPDSNEWILDTNTQTSRYDVHKSFDPSYLALGIQGYGEIQCEMCFAGKSLSLGTPISGLVQGHQYELTFYRAGMVHAVAPNILPAAVDPLIVSLGSFSSGLISVPSVNEDVTLVLPFQKATLDFTYLDAASTAKLSFSEVISGLFSPANCTPCINFTSLANVTLTDVTVTPPPPPPPPPPPNVAEPSSLGLLGLSLLVLGFGVWRSRRPPRAPDGTAAAGWVAA